MTESKQHMIWVAGPVLGIISFIATSLRVYTRSRIIRSFGIDDMLIVIAELLTLAYLICILVAAKHGLGMHLKDLTPDNVRKTIQANWGSSQSYTLQIMFAKISLLFFYLRIGGPRCGGLPTWFRISTIILITLTVVIGIISEVIIIFQCKPANHQWNRLFPGADPEGKCWDLVVFYFIHAGLNIFLDVVITILPMPLLLSLELPRRQKMGLCGLFSLGGVVCIISLVRVLKLPALNKSKDITWDITDAIVWYYVESTLIVIAACGPSLKPLIRKYAPGLLGSKTPDSSEVYQGRGSDGTTSYRVGRRFVEGVIAPLPPGHQASTHITSSKDRSFYGECDSEERIVQEEMGMGIMKRTDVVMTVESQSEIDLTISRDTLQDVESGGIRLEVLSSSNVYVENSKVNS